MPIYQKTRDAIGRLIRRDLERRDIPFFRILQQFILSHPEPGELSDFDIKQAISPGCARLILGNEDLMELRRDDPVFNYYIAKISAAYSVYGFSSAGGSGGAGGESYVSGADVSPYARGGGGGIVEQPRARGIVGFTRDLPDKGHLNRFERRPYVRFPTYFPTVGEEEVLIPRLRNYDGDGGHPDGGYAGDGGRGRDEAFLISGETNEKIKALMERVPRRRSYINSVYSVIQMPELIQLSLQLRLEVSRRFSPEDALEFIDDPFELKPILMSDPYGVIYMLEIAFALTKYYDSWLYFYSLTKYSEFKYCALLKTLEYLPLWMPDDIVLQEKMRTLSEFSLKQIFYFYHGDRYSSRDDMIDAIIREVDRRGVDDPCTNYAEFLTVWVVLKDEKISFPPSRTSGPSYYHSYPISPCLIPFVESLPLNWEVVSVPGWASSLFSYADLKTNLLGVLQSRDPSLSDIECRDFIVRAFLEADKPTRAEWISRWIAKSWDLFNLPVGRVMVAVQTVQHRTEFFIIWKMIGSRYKKFEPSSIGGLAVYKVGSRLRNRDTIGLLNDYCRSERNDSPPGDILAIESNEGLQPVGEEGAEERGTPPRQRRRIGDPVGDGGAGYPGGRDGGAPYGGGGGGAGY